MNWIELRSLEGWNSIFLFGCLPTESAYKVKAWLKEKKPDIIVLYAGEHRLIKNYQASHWVHQYDNCFHNYMTEGHRKDPVYSPLASLHTALQRFHQLHNYTPSEIVLVRAKKLLNTSKQVT